MNNNELNYAEISLSSRQLALMPESAGPWYVKHAEDDTDVGPFVKELSALLWKVAKANLTSQQRTIAHRYYKKKQTQAKIAEQMHISQATVNHHLTGKMRKGKTVGGTLEKIRKSIRKEAAKGCRTDCRRGQLISALDDALHKPTTRRGMNSIIKHLFKIANEQPCPAGIRVKPT